LLVPFVKLLFSSEFFVFEQGYLCFGQKHWSVSDSRFADGLFSGKRLWPSCWPGFCRRSAKLVCRWSLKKALGLNCHFLTPCSPIIYPPTIGNTDRDAPDAALSRCLSSLPTVGNSLQIICDKVNKSLPIVGKTHMFVFVEVHRGLPIVGKTF
jgi:hypothetical protein